MKYLGVDGCKPGWLAIEVDENNNWSANIYQDFTSIIKENPFFELILIDIPIGLKESGSTERLCDIEARKLLPRVLKASVFRVPCRSAVYKTESYKASQINFQLTGKRLSHQVWGIVPRIREVDSFMRSRTDYAGKVRESHPEVCFYFLSDGKIKHSKKTKVGVFERLKILKKKNQLVEDIFHAIYKKYSRRKIQPDDVLDALVLAVTAQNSQKLRTIPEVPEIDAFGLPMEIVYSV